VASPRVAAAGGDGLGRTRAGPRAPERERRASPEELARPHLYDDERIVWIERQRVPRLMGRRLLLAAPGAALGWLAAWLVARTRAAPAEPSALGPGLEVLWAALALAAIAWLRAAIYLPIKAYRGVRGAYAVLTDRRLLWVEALADGTSRVRHPTRTAILAPGELRSITVHERSGGAGTIHMRGAPASGARPVRLYVRGDARSADEVAALLRRYLAVRAPAPRRLVTGSVRARHS
jgi:hypothetical protein